MLQDLLATEQVTALDEFLSPSGSFCWLVILLAVFALFYLIFCSYYKINKMVKLIGWSYSAFMLACDIIILAIHLDIFTLGGTLFSLMLIMAILSIVLPNMSASPPNADDQTKPRTENVGCYVVREFVSGRTCFELYDKNNKFIVRSLYSYKDVPQAREQIGVARTNGKLVALEDRTGPWIEEATHPKFEMYKENDLYYFHLAINGKYVILKSQGYQKLSTCKQMLQKAMKAVLSEKVYLSVEKLSDDEFGFTEFNWYDATLMSATSEGPPLVEEAVDSVEITETAVEVREPISIAEAEIAVTSNDEAEAMDTGIDPPKPVLTLWERYALLDETGRRFFDEIRAKAQSFPNVKENETKFYLTFKLKRDLLLKLQIKRGVVETVFMLIDPEFKEHLNDYDDVKVAETPTPIKVENEAYFNVVLETIDLRYTTIVEQQRQKEEARRLARSEARKAKRAEQSKLEK